MKPPAFNSAVIIPTGIGAAIGGYGGDAMTLLSLFAGVCDTVVTHPNVANAACFQKLPENVLYVEGLGLDRFFEGRWQLKPVRQNRVGLLWDSGISADMRVLHDNAVAAVQTVYGVNITAGVETQEPVDLALIQGPSGRSAGRVKNPEVLFEAASRLLGKGATAIALCCRMPEVEDGDLESAYQSGQGVDPIGGIEAMLSHLLVDRFQVPVAHAPVFSWEMAHPVLDRHVDPRAASEFIVPTFLPCVLTGLAKAPQFEEPEASRLGAFTIEDLHALIVPTDALGSLPVLSALERNIPVLAVQNNTTVMDCPPEALGLSDRVISCANYLEAAGRLLAMKQGICCPEHFYTPVAAAEETRSATYASA